MKRHFVKLLLAMAYHQKGMTKGAIAELQEGVKKPNGPSLLLLHAQKLFDMSSLGPP